MNGKIKRRYNSLVIWNLLHLIKIDSETGCLRDTFFRQKDSDEVKLLAHRAGPFDRAHGPEHAEWASWQGTIIVPINPAFKAGIAGYVPATIQ